MSEQRLSSNKQHIVNLLNQNELLINSDLVHLSDLTDEELAFFKQEWQKADVKRRRRIISDLVKLYEVDFRLDFSNIFVSCLKDKDVKVRMQAIAGLELGEDYLHVPLLFEILQNDASVKVKEAAISVIGNYALLGELGKLPDDKVEKIYSVLLEILENKAGSVNLRSKSLEAIAPLSKPRVKELIEEAYKSKDSILRLSAIRAMGINNQPFWLDTLLNELNSSEFEIRYAAVWACGELGVDEALPYIIKLLETEDIPIQEVAIRALGEIGSEKARQTLEIFKKNPKRRLRQAAKMALEELDICEDPLSFDF